MKNKAWEYMTTDELMTKREEILSLKKLLIASKGQKFYNSAIELINAHIKIKSGIILTK